MHLVGLAVFEEELAMRDAEPRTETGTMKSPADGAVAMRTEETWRTH